MARFRGFVIVIAVFVAVAVAVLCIFFGCVNVVDGDRGWVGGGSIATASMPSSLSSSGLGIGHVCVRRCCCRCCHSCDVEWLEVGVPVGFVLGAALQNKVHFDGGKQLVTSQDNAWVLCGEPGY